MCKIYSLSKDWESLEVIWINRYVDYIPFVCTDFSTFYFLGGGAKKNKKKKKRKEVTALFHT